MLHRCTTLGRTSKLQFLQIFGRRNAFTIRCVFSYKIVNGMAPSYMSNLLPNLVRDNNPYNLRNRNNIAIPRVRLSVRKTLSFQRLFHCGIISVKTQGTCQHLILSNVLLNHFTGTALTMGEFWRENTKLFSPD